MPDPGDPGTGPDGPGANAHDIAAHGPTGAHDPTVYGATIADEYDELYDDVLDTEAAVACLADLSAGGPVLELGVGTGRLALPLAGRGLAVTGVDASPAMVARLAAKPGVERLRVVVGDIADVEAPGGPFRLAVLAFNTVFALPTDAAQLACFATVARHLAPGGRFVVEAWVLDPGRFVGGAAVGVRYVMPDRVSLDTAVLDPAPLPPGGQNVRAVQVVFSPGRVRLFPTAHRYAGPSELDVMAGTVGFALEHRWAGWGRAPFDEASRTHVSVYRAPDR
ncbi:MAG: class I SAM-dependent methyltransferase [Acidimicrobiales bacterium]